MPLLSMATSGGACTVKLLSPFHPNAVGLANQTCRATAPCSLAGQSGVVCHSNFFSPVQCKDGVLQRVLHTCNIDFQPDPPNI